jgi:glycosyltransferase involved in cell wall biosynthesis
MACGTPIVTCPVGGIPDVLTEGAQRCLRSSRRPDRLADALESILADDEMRAAMGRAGPSDARRFEPAGVIDTLRPHVCGVPADGGRAAS